MHVARQPIFNRQEQTVAYELLYRNENGHHPGKLVNADQATIDVLAASLLSIGLEQISGGKQLFINFTKNLLLQDFPDFLTAESIVIEILEDVDANPEVLAACQILKEKGYIIALDDFLLNASNKGLVKYADIIKVDFLNTTKAERRKMKNEMMNNHITWLAEKVEKREHFLEALEEGFDLFQGFFFSKPALMSAKSIPRFSQNYFTILKEVMQDSPDVKKTARLIEADLTLSYKLLKLLNKTAFIRRGKVKTIHQAIMLIGLEELKKWLFFIMADSSNAKCSEEIIRTSLIRAKTLEQLSFSYFPDEPSSQFFLLGMFSMIDVLLNEPMAIILRDLPIDGKVKQALLLEEGRLSNMLKLIKEMESGHWTTASRISKQLQIEDRILSESYQEALKWGDIVLKETTSLDRI
ncbi:EAL and HDOD domain-containing protein [Bacillus aerolatus]|uniref:EAL and HDOD domain-containing protein n=1 Tax=Bacillus aerolatus TaxID=2653354 RepID=UPI001CDD7B18|nr:HDOD domain-containing protein [Bacillus aerolatus]